MVYTGPAAIYLAAMEATKPSSCGTSSSTTSTTTASSTSDGSTSDGSASSLTPSQADSESGFEDARLPIDTASATASDRSSTTSNAAPDSDSDDETADLPSNSSSTPSAVVARHCIDDSGRFTDAVLAAEEAEAGGDRARSSTLSKAPGGLSGVTGAGNSVASATTKEDFWEAVRKERAAERAKLDALLESSVRDAFRGGAFRGWSA